MNPVNRRRLLLLGLYGCSSLVSGCFWDGSSTDFQAAAPSPEPAPAAPAPAPSPSPAPAPAPAPSPTPPPAAPKDWSVSPTPYFLTGTGSTFDLSSTLPTGVRKGGLFAVDPKGAQLPAGMVLSASGLLSVGNAAAGRADGVIFTYAEPAG